MTDAVVAAVPKQRLDPASAQARRRVRARYASERRFKAFGLIALLVTGIFLLLLLVDIVRNGLPAFTRHTLDLAVAIPADFVPADKRNDPVAIRGADYYPLTRDALKAVIPGEFGRTAERALGGLLSSGAADGLRNRLVANPALMGSTVELPLLLSADADLYFKGIGTDIETAAGEGTATPSAMTGEVTVLTTSSDFASAIAASTRAAEARIMRLQAEKRRLAVFKAPSIVARLKEIETDLSSLAERIANPKSVVELDIAVPSLLVAVNGGLIKLRQVEPGRATGDVLLPLQSAAPAAPGAWRLVTYTTAESDRKVSDQQVAFLERFRSEGKLAASFNWAFFTGGDSREPEQAGIRGALVGSALTLFVTLILCLPIGVLAALYLEEFAPKNRWTDLIEVNINNLAAVPSIVFGLLGLSIFLGFFGLPRSAPLVGGLVLALMSLPTIIIAARAALKAVPPSIKEAALGVGASHQQAVFHHVLPLAMPGIMTGTIIAMAQALGETAPLLMIGMVAFIVDVPQTFTQAATVLPVQIYLWSDLPELAFKYKTAAAIMVLLAFLFVMNGLAIYLRKKFEQRW